MVPVEQLALALLHHRLVVGLGVVVAEEVEDPVDQQQGHLVDIHTIIVNRLPCGNSGANHNVAQQHRLIIGHLGGIVDRVVKWKGENIGRAAVAVKVLCPEVGYGLFVHEVDSELHARLGEALGDEHIGGETSPAVGIDLGARTGGGPFVDDHDRGAGFRRFVAHPGQEPLRRGVLRS